MASRGYKVCPDEDLHDHGRSATDASASPSGALPKPASTWWACYVTDPERSADAGDIARIRPLDRRRLTVYEAILDFDADYMFYAPLVNDLDVVLAPALRRHRAPLPAARALQDRLPSAALAGGRDAELSARLCSPRHGLDGHLLDPPIRSNIVSRSRSATASIAGSGRARRGTSVASNEVHVVLRLRVGGRTGIFGQRSAGRGS